MALSSSEKMKKYRLDQKYLGRKKRDMYLTDVEYAALKAELERLRSK